MLCAPLWDDPQFLENLSDHQAADAIRARIDWKYALGLELTDPGFDSSVLSTFRARLIAGEAGTDPFGSWVVEISYGRIGTAGRSRCFVVRDAEHARLLIRTILRRRAGAPRRIGVPYRIRELIDPAGWVGPYGAMSTP